MKGDIAPRSVGRRSGLMLTPWQRGPFQFSVFLVLGTHWGCTFLLPLPSVELPTGSIMSSGCSTASFLLAGQPEAPHPCGEAHRKQAGPGAVTLLKSSLFHPVRVSEGLSLPAETWSHGSLVSIIQQGLSRQPRAGGAAQPPFRTCLCPASFSLSQLGLLLWSSEITS